VRLALTARVLEDETTGPLANVPADHTAVFVGAAPVGRLGKFDLPVARLSGLGDRHLALGRPEDIAAACAYLVSDGGAFVTGQVLCPNGGVYM